MYHTVTTDSDITGILVLIRNQFCVPGKEKLYSFQKTKQKIDHESGSIQRIYNADQKSCYRKLCAMLNCSVMSDSLEPRGLWPTRFFCPWGFSRQKYWSGLPCSPPGDLPNPGIEPRFPHCRWILYHLSYQRPKLRKPILNVNFKNFPKAAIK